MYKFITKLQGRSKDLLYPMKEFNKWLKSDNVIPVDGGYRTQCTQYQKLFTLAELKTYFKKEYK